MQVYILLRFSSEWGMIYSTSSTFSILEKLC